MGKEEQAAYVVAQAACAVVEAISIKAGMKPDGTLEYRQRKEAEIHSLIQKYGLDHNSVLSWLRG